MKKLLLLLSVAPIIGFSQLKKEGIHLLFEDTYLSSDSLKIFPMKVISKQDNYKKGWKHGKNITYRFGEHKWKEVKDENGNVISYQDDQYKIIEKYNYGEWISKKKKGLSKKDFKKIIPSSSNLIYWHVYKAGLIKERKGVTYFKNKVYSGKIYYGDGLEDVNPITGSIEFVNGRPATFNLYYKNGSLENKFLIDNTGGNEDGLTGTSTEYFETGEVSSTVDYTNGEPNGTETGYYRTGEVRYALDYTNGEPNGTETGYYETGEVNYVVTRGGNDGDNVYVFFDKNQLKLNGSVVTKYKNGETRSVCEYINGNPVGVMRTFRLDGSKSSNYSFKRGLLDGKQVYFKKNGSVEKVEYFDNGILIREKGE